MKTNIRMGWGEVAPVFAPTAKPIIANRWLLLFLPELASVILRWNWTIEPPLNMEKKNKYLRSVFFLLFRRRVRRRVRRRRRRKRRKPTRSLWDNNNINLLENELEFPGPLMGRIFFSFFGGLLHFSLVDQQQASINRCFFDSHFCVVTRRCGEGAILLPLYHCLNNESGRKPQEAGW